MVLSQHKTKDKTITLPTSFLKRDHASCTDGRDHD